MRRVMYCRGLVAVKAKRRLHALRQPRPPRKHPVVHPLAALWNPRTSVSAFALAALASRGLCFTTWRCVSMPRAAGRASAELISAVRRSKGVRFEEDKLVSCTAKRVGDNRGKLSGTWVGVRRMGPGMINIRDTLQLVRETTVDARGTPLRAGQLQGCLGRWALVPRFHLHSADRASLARVAVPEGAASSSWQPRTRRSPPRTT